MKKGGAGDWLLLILAIFLVLLALGGGLDALWQHLLDWLRNGTPASPTVADKVSTTSPPATTSGGSPVPATKPDPRTSFSHAPYGTDVGSQPQSSGSDGTGAPSPGWWGRFRQWWDVTQGLNQPGAPPPGPAAGGAPELPSFGELPVFGGA